MFNKRNKKKGFTLIELIIVIAIIAILAAIAVPAFGQIRQKANASADLGNARTIYSLVTTEIASDNITLPTGDTPEIYPLEAVGEGTVDSGAVDIGEQIEPAPVVKTTQGNVFLVQLDSDGNIIIGHGTDETDKNFKQIYPEATSETEEEGN